MAQSHQRPFSRRQLAVIAKIAFIEAMALSLIIPTISSTGEITTTNCTQSNGLCGPIQFNTSVSANSTSQVLTTLTTPSWASSTGEFMAISVAESSFAGVTKITDLANDNFTQLPLFFNPSVSFSRLEVWTGFFSGIGSNSITVNINTTSPMLVMVSAYRNVAGVGAVNGTTTADVLSQTVLLNTTQSGSWVVGTSTIDPVSLPTSCQVIKPGTFLLQRINTCTGTQAVNNFIQGDMEDNGTSLRNGFLFNYTSTWNGDNQGGPGMFPDAITEVFELIPRDREPISQVDNDPFCKTIGDSCHTNFSNKNSGATASSQSLVAGTTYCTGIGTSALVTTVSSTLLITGQYSIQDLNVTGEIILLRLLLTNTVPQTTFGTGASCNGQATTIVMYFPITSNALTTSFSFGVVKSSGTYYASLDIVPQTNPVKVTSFGASTASWLELVQLN